MTIDLFLLKTMFVPLIAGMKLEPIIISSMETQITLEISKLESRF